MEGEGYKSLFLRSRKIEGETAAVQEHYQWPTDLLIEWTIL
jgi:hypothetical protein